MARKPRIPELSDGAFGFLLHDIARLMRRNFNHRARHLGLTQAQYRVILHLSRCEGIQQVALAERLDIQPITLARLLDKLEAARLVERRRDPDDGRAFCLYLTEHAYPLLQSILKLARQTRQDAIGSLSAADLDRLVRILAAMKDNLAQADDTIPGAAAPAAPRSREVP